MAKFCAILFPPARAAYEDLTREIQNRFEILDSYSLDINEWTDFIRDIYKLDSMQEWKLIGKIKILQKYPKQVQVVMFDVPEPKYTSKKGGVICVQTKKFKKTVRKKYSKKVREYQKKGWHKPDLIIHVGDTPEHTAFLETIFDELRDVRD